MTVRGSSDVGIQVAFNSFLRLTGSLVTRSAGDGIFIDAASSLIVNPTTSITGNAGADVSVGALASATFHRGTVATGNAGGDVVCSSQLAATRGALDNIGGGTTNCVEP